MFDDSLPKLTKYLEATLTWSKRLFTPVALLFLLLAGWQSRFVLATVLATAKPGYLVLATLLLMTPHFISAMATLRILKASGVSSISYQFALQTQINRLLARYLPGGVWHTVGRMMDFHAQGVNSSELTKIFLLENILAIAVSFLLGSLGIWYFRGLTDGWGQLAAWLTLGNLLGLAVTPLLLKKWGEALQIKFYLQAIGWFVPIWLLFAASFVCYFSAFPMISGEISVLEVGSTYLFSWAVGLIMIFAPQGIGVFEVVVGHILNVSLSAASLAALIAGFRIVSLVADVTLWGIFRIFWSGRSNH